MRVLENKTIVLARIAFSDLQALKSRINGHDEDFDVLETIQIFLKMTDQRFQKMTMTLNNYHLVIKMPIKAFTVYTKVLRIYVSFYDMYSRAFDNFLPALDALSNIRLTHQIINPVTLERYLRAI